MPSLSDLLGFVTDSLGSVPDRVRAFDKQMRSGDTSGIDELAEGFAGGGMTKAAAAKGVGAVGDLVKKFVRGETPAETKAADVLRPSTGESASIEEAARKTAAVRGVAPITVPEGPEFWPWRTEHGGYQSAFDAKKGKWYAQKITSPDEARLAKAVDAAQKDLPTMPPVWDAAGAARPVQQDMAMEYASHAKGMPEWIAKQYGPGFQKMVKQGALSAEDPNAWKFYWTRQLQDDFAKTLGPEERQKAFQMFADSMGATTSGARPPQNVKMASYQQMRLDQGLPPTGTPPYPYGHNYSSGSHLKALQNVVDSGRLDPAVNPKGATFAGNISGQTGNPTMDVVMSQNTGLTDQAGKALQAPHDMAYQAPVDAFDRVVSDLARTKGKIPPEVQAGLQPSDVQSAAWAKFGGDPSYARTLLQHISDRINVTARVTGLPVDVVKEMFMRKQIPLLSAGAGGISLSDLMEQRQ